VAPAWVLAEFHTPSRGPRDHETLHHVTVLELVPNWVHVVWAGHHEEFDEVVGRRPRLTLVTVRGCRDVPHARATHLPAVAIIIVGCGPSPLRTLLVPPFATLGTVPGALDGDVGHRLPATTWGRLPTGSILGNDAA
jgi:hypothetical protein